MAEPGELAALKDRRRLHARAVEELMACAHTVLSVHMLVVCVSALALAALRALLWPILVSGLH